MRSYLFVPGDSERKLEKSLTSGADCLLIDLEDSVAVAQKAVARESARDFLTSQPFNHTRPGDGGSRQPLSSGLTDDDLKAVIAGRPDALLLPKCEHGADIQQLSAMMAVHEAEAGLDEGRIGIHALVTESGLGTLNAASYVGVSPRLLSLSWGAEDLSADLGVETNRDADGVYTDLFRYARTVTLLGAADGGCRGRSTRSSSTFATPKAWKRNVVRRSATAFPERWLSTRRKSRPSTGFSRRRLRLSITQRGIVDLFAEAGRWGSVFLSLDGKDDRSTTP